MTDPMTTPTTPTVPARVPNERPAMSGCEHHHDTNAPCTCTCDEHAGVRREMAQRAEIAAKVEASSLGTPGAKALRATVSDEQVAKVLARAKELDTPTPVRPEPQGGGDRLAGVIAEAMYDVQEWSGCAGSRWSGLLPETQKRWMRDAEHVAAALRDHGVLGPEEAERLRADLEFAREHVADLRAALAEAGEPDA